MVLIPTPSDSFIKKVKAKMRAEKIKDFSEDELSRVFEYVIQSDNCLRVINYLIKNENFTINELYEKNDE